MTSRIFILSLVLGLVGCKGKSDYENKLDQHRVTLLGHWLNPKTTPFDSTELSAFKGLDYFPINESLKTEAQLMWLPQTTFFEMPHTGGDFKMYMKVAVLYFKIGNQTFQLQAYQTERMRTQRMLFVPFADITNGKTTYGGGRYLDISYAPQATTCTIDFNFAYAPYCAHSHSYSCPIVPAENNLNIAIEAGEKLIP